MKVVLQKRQQTFFASDVMLDNIRIPLKFNIDELINSEKEIVICAAVRAFDGHIVRGQRHADAMRTLHGMPAYAHEHTQGDNQGFVTSLGRYVTRKDGAEIQKAAGIKSVMPEGMEYLHGELYSEDLY